MTGVLQLGCAQASFALQQGKPTGAAFRIEAARQQPPSESTALVEQARLALRSGDAIEAERLFRIVLERQPEDGASALELAKLLEQEQRSREAVEILAVSSEALLQQARFADSIALLERLVEIEPPAPGRTLWLTRLGRVLLLEQRFEEARDRLEQALAEQSTRGSDRGSDEPIRLELASVLWELGELVSAEQLLLPLAEAGSKAAHRQLGGFLLWQGRFEHAALWLDKAAAGRRAGSLPVDLRIDLARALAGALEEEYGEAGGAGLPPEELDRVIAVFRSALSAAPEHSELHFGYASLLDRYAGDERRTEAQRHFSTARELMAADQAANRQSALLESRFASARTALAAGDPVAALAELEGVRGVTEAHRLRAQAHLALDDFTAARSEVLRALGLEPGRADLRALLAEIRTRTAEE